MKKLVAGFLAVFSIFLFTPFAFAQDEVPEEESVVEDVIEEEVEEPSLISPNEEGDDTTITIVEEDAEKEGTNWVMVVSLVAVGVVLVVVIVAMMSGKRE